MLNKFSRTKNENIFSFKYFKAKNYSHKAVYCRKLKQAVFNTRNSIKNSPTN